MKSLLSIIFLFTVSICSIPETWALERIRWKVQVINNEVYWGDLWKEYVEIVKQLSDGKIRFKIYDPNSIVPNAEAWGAIADDQLDAALSSPIYLSYKIPAVHFFRVFLSAQTSSSIRRGCVTAEDKNLKTKFIRKWEYMLLIV